MRYSMLMVTMSMVAAFALAQPPADDALQSGQRKAGTAFSELQKAEYETKRAEQEYRQADTDHKAAQKRADESKRQADAAQKKLEAAKAKEAGKRKTYDAAVEAVDKIAHPAGKQK